MRRGRWSVKIEHSLARRTTRPRPFAILEIVSLGARLISVVRWYHLGIRGGSVSAIKDDRGWPL